MLAGATLILPLGRRINDLYVARMIEKAHPDFRNDLTAALQLTKDGRVHPGSLRAIRHRAAVETANIDTGASVNLHGLKVATVVLVAGGRRDARLRRP